MNPFDEISRVEEAVRHEGKAGVADRGHRRCPSVRLPRRRKRIRTVARHGRRPGASWSRPMTPGLEPLAVAKLPRQGAERRGRALKLVIVLGKQAIDDDSNQTGQMTRRAAGPAARATFASEGQRVDGDSAVGHPRSRWRPGDRQAVSPARGRHGRPPL